MVKSAYSSGKPSYSVGAGNVQVIIDKGVDYEKAAVTPSSRAHRSTTTHYLLRRTSFIYREMKIFKAFVASGAYIVPEKEREPGSQLPYLATARW